ncbi:MAG: AMP-binding protein, partial [Burkholderiaceae bacterium]|nr:AMP-binding protein [Burkholderiaceae bacterium]
MAQRPQCDDYPAMHGQFRWQVPRQFNMAEVCMRRWAASPATERRTAIIEHRAAGPGQRYTYAQLQQAADALSHALLSLGVQRGDRVAIVLPQRFETAVSYMAVLQIGA